MLLEAMAAGVPIVCSDIHGYKGVVRRNEQAVLVPPRDVEGLAAALGTLLRDPLLRQRMGEAGRERAEQFSWEAVTARVEEYYGFVVRRLAAAGTLPPGSAPIPEPPTCPEPAWSTPCARPVAGPAGPSQALTRDRTRCGDGRPPGALGRRLSAGGASASPAPARPPARERRRRPSGDGAHDEGPERRRGRPPSAGSG